MEDILSVMGTFLTNKEIFYASTVNKEWRRSQNFNKKIRLEKVKDDVWKAHLLNNFCPCLLENYYKSLINNFRLKRYMCSHLNDDEKAPPWLSEYI
jgi:hypothetical protein